MPYLSDAPLNTLRYIHNDLPLLSIDIHDTADNLKKYAV